MEDKRLLITNDKLIREVSKASSISIAKTKSVFENLDIILAKHLKEADSDNGIMIKLLNGLNIYSDYQPEKTHSFLGKDIVVSQRIRPKAVFTREYVKRLNNK